MATIGDVLKQTLQKLHPEQDTTQFGSAMLDHALQACNDMLETWSLDRLKCWETTNSAFSTASSTASYTIGTGKTWNVVQPIEIEGAYITVGGEDYDLEIIKRRAYLKIKDKTKPGRPTRLYFKRGVNGVTDGLVFLWPTPTAIESISLDMRTVIGNYANTAVTFSMPTGYRNAIVWNLALTLCPDYEIEPSETIKKWAAESIAAIMNLNTPVELSGLKGNEPKDRGRVMDIERG